MGRLVDVHVCDYNYVFDPSVYLKHFFQDNRHRDKILIIDEAHNLYSRAMDYYSPSLCRADIRDLLERLPHDPRLGPDLGKWLRSIDAEFRELSKIGREDHGNAPKYEVELPVAFFERKRDELEALTIRYHLYRVTNKIAAADDPFEAFFAAFYYFTNVLALKGDEFSHLFDKTEGSQEIEVLCKCPSRQLRARLNGFHSVIAMSATLEPMNFYRDVLGFDAVRTDSLVLPSPFPSQHRKIVVIPSLSTTYKMRGRSYTELANTIARIVQTRRGNYAAFFPSFDYLRAVEPILRQLCPYLLVQQRDMDQAQRDELLLQVREQRDRLILAVQGGVFSEGVDFPGEQLIGVIVVSPALPTVSFERELMRQYYDEHYDYRGFEYAYLYPGMARVIQSVGRLIRTETDRGIAALICERFATPQYNRLFPRHWYEQDVEDLCPRDWEAELVRFWETPFGKG
jgi:DNA excision repair protein ERCC-2